MFGPSQLRNFVSVLVLIIFVTSSGCGLSTSLDFNSLGVQFDETISSKTYSFDVRSIPSLSTTSYWIITNSESVSISGNCDSNKTIFLNGDASASAKCENSTYNFEIAKSTDGTYKFTLYQQDEYLLNSEPLSVEWIRDTVPPLAPAVSLASSSPTKETTISLTLDSCNDIAGVFLNEGSKPSLDASGWTSCSTNTGGYKYSLTSVNQDGPYTVKAWFKDSAGNVTADAASVNLEYDSTAPKALTIIAPTSMDFFSKNTELQITGKCDLGTNVNVTGSVDQSTSTPCKDDGSFSIKINKIDDNTYNFNIAQIDSAGNSSETTKLKWTLDRVAPNKPIPANTSYISKTSPITIQGACDDNTTLTLSGANSDAVECNDKTFSIAVTATNEKSYNLTVTATDRAGNVSQASDAITWTFDKTAPQAPQITSPETSPNTTEDTTLTIIGDCEKEGTKVTLTGDTTTTTLCDSNNKFNFSITKNNEAIYTFNIFQTDAAGNDSQTTTQQWELDLPTPESPQITSPTIDSQNRHYTKVNPTQVVLSGTCEIGAIVNLSGDILETEVSTPSQTLSTDCALNGTFSFTFQKNDDGIYDINIVQISKNGITSATTLFTLIKDTQAPNAPVITNPSVDTYVSSDNLTLSGTCESGATVTLSDSGNPTTYTECVDSSFNFPPINKLYDGQYTFIVSQTDQAGNSSYQPGPPPTGYDQITWEKNSTLPSTPTITFPNNSPYYSQNESFTISGGCTSNYKVVLKVNNSADTIQPLPCASNLYTFTYPINTDGSYTLTVTQKDSSGEKESGPASVTWVLDTVAPTLTITSSPPDPNLQASATFQFGSNEPNTTFKCMLKVGNTEGTYGDCTSPKNYTDLTNGNYVFYVKGTDLAGNTSQIVNKGWSQQNYKTIALYHFDNDPIDNDPSPTVDSSNYTGTENNDLTDSNTTVGSTYKFNQSRNFSLANACYMEASDNSSQDLGRQTMTIEAFVKLNSLPVITYTYNTDTKTNSYDYTKAYMTIASKSGNSGQYGWRFGYRYASSTKVYLYFAGSLNGTNIYTKLSSSFSINTTALHHVAVTWDKGTVKFYFDGVQKGSRTIGTAGSATLYQNNAPLSIGKDGRTSYPYYLDGIIDELRISQVVRWTTTFSVPTAPYTPD